MLVDHKLYVARVVLQDPASVDALVAAGPLGKKADRLPSLNYATLWRGLGNRDLLMLFLCVVLEPSVNI